MNDAKLYEENNHVQKRDAFDCLVEYSDKIKWRNTGDRLIDIGCGDGGVTIKLLKKFIPHNFERVLGCDISVNMVNFANEHYKDDNTSFAVLDIGGNLPVDMRGKFDHAFSFYALNWIKDQETAFNNIYDLITAGGDCLLLFLGYHTYYDIYRILAQRSKWSSWLQPLDSFISPYYDSKEPDKEIKSLMAKIGFSDIVVNCQKKTFIFDSLEIMTNAIQAVNPFQMPKEIWDDFIQDYLQVIRDNEANNNQTSGLTVHYTLITVYGTK
ncbi:hypothetical protein ACJJTC_006739 [Scirpophaga incertulas]